MNTLGFRGAGKQASWLEDTSLVAQDRKPSDGNTDCQASWGSGVRGGGGGLGRQLIYRASGQLPPEGDLVCWDSCHPCWASLGA